MEARLSSPLYVGLLVPLLWIPGLNLSPRVRYVSLMNGLIEGGIVTGWRTARHTGQERKKEYEYGIPR